MKYGEVDLLIKKNSMSVRKTKSQLVRHYPGTDKVNYAPLGKSETVITCTLIAIGEDQRILYEQILHSDEKKDLEIKNHYYKEVITGESADPVPVTPDQEIWEIDAEFIALDPVPYSSDTDLRLY